VSAVECLHKTGFEKMSFNESFVPAFDTASSFASCTFNLDYIIYTYTANINKTHLMPHKG
jgi:hypothetical protein